MKKTFAILFSFLLLLRLAACGGGDGGASDTTAQDGANNVPSVTEAPVEPTDCSYLANANVGDHIVFGAYEQDNDGTNGKEPIEWLVLAKENGRLLVISGYALDCKKYNDDYAPATWESCTLRAWLNGEFRNAAFSPSEQLVIPAVAVTAQANPEYATAQGNDVTDRVFLLSVTEAQNYFASDEARICGATDYAVAQGAYTSKKYTAGDKAACWWWFRTSGGAANKAANADCGGSVGFGGVQVNYGTFAVRPAMWIDIGG